MRYSIKTITIVVNLGTVNAVTNTKIYKQKAQKQISRNYAFLEFFLLHIYFF